MRTLEEAILVAALDDDEEALAARVEELLDGEVAVLRRAMRKIEAALCERSRTRLKELEASG